MPLKLPKTWELIGLIRIEEFDKVSADYTAFDPMLFKSITELNQDIYTINIKPEPILEIADIDAYNKQEGLALSVRKKLIT